MCQKFAKHTGVQKCGTGALRNLTQSVVDNRDAAFDVGAVQVIINGMKSHTEIPELQGWACDALANISLSGNEAKDTIIEFEGLEAIVKATRTHKKDPEVQKRAATAMQHFYSTWWGTLMDEYDKINVGSRLGVYVYTFSKKYSWINLR